MDLTKSALTGAFLLASCSRLLGQDDGFSKKLAAGCQTVASCEELSSEAESRVASCRDNTIGSIDCGQARKDRDKSYRLVYAARTAEDSSRNLESSLESSRVAVITKRASDDAEIERKEREEAERVLRRTEAEAKIAEEKLAREKERNERKEERARYLRLVGREAREKLLRSCLDDSYDCSKLLLELLDAAEGPIEQKNLLALNERLLEKSFQSATVPPEGPIMCCDGSVSSTCVCGGKLRGCCSSHGGVCGCGPVR